MLRVWVHGCDPGRVSDGSRLALCQTLSIECPSSIFFWHDMCILLFLFLSLCRFCVFVFFFCSHWSLVDVPLISFCPADHVPDWQPRIVLGMVEARSVNVKKTTTTISMQGHQNHNPFYLSGSSGLRSVVAVVIWSFMVLEKLNKLY